eukprot:8754-Prymnesium_polylepis.3
MPERPRRLHDRVAYGLRNSICTCVLAVAPGVATTMKPLTGVMVRGRVPRAQRAGFFGTRERSERGFLRCAIFLRFLPHFP